MFNKEIEITEENIAVIFAAALLENLKYGIISLNIMFDGHITREYFNDKHTFYFFHMQSVLTAQGNIWNVFRSTYPYYRDVCKMRVQSVREKLGVDINKYPLVGNKKFRNTNEHFDDRYYFGCDRGGIGDFNVLDETTPLEDRNKILKSYHLRTIDLIQWKYITYDRNGKQLVLDLKELRREMCKLFQEISNSEAMRLLEYNHNPRNVLIDLENNDNDQL